MMPALVYVLPATVVTLYLIRKYRERTWGWCTNNVDLTQKLAIITGANSGIGFQTAKELAKRNANLVLCCRNMQKAEQTAERIRNQTQTKANLIPMELDLTSLKSVQNFAAWANDKLDHIDILINNAGVSYPKKVLERTKDDIEIHFGVNHLAHFYLTNLLLDKLKNTVASRIIVVASTLHERGTIDLNGLKRLSWDSSAKLYANSKLANVYFARELMKKVKGSTVKVYAVCPGWVFTSLFRHTIKWYHYFFVTPIAFFFMRSAKQGCQTVVYCATEPKLESGLYRDGKPYISKVKFEDKVAEELWKISEHMVAKVTNPL